MGSVKKAIIPAAGLGTRFLPATKAQPKEMLPIVDKPTLQYIIEEAVASGITEILIITGRNKSSIEDHFDKSIELELELEKHNKHEQLKMVQDISNMVNIHYIRQKEPKGLGHAVYCAKSFIGNEPFAVLLGDDVVDSKVPCLKQLLDVYNKYGKSVLGVKQVEKDQVDKYGIVNPKYLEEGLMEVKELVEKPEVSKSPSNVAILGRYIITPEIFNILENQTPGKNGEIQLTDALNTLLERESIYAYEFEGERYDIGDKFGFIKATIDFALKKPELEKPLMEYMQSLVK